MVLSKIIKIQRWFKKVRCVNNFRNAQNNNYLMRKNSLYAKMRDLKFYVAGLELEQKLRFEAELRR